MLDGSVLRWLGANEFPREYGLYRTLVLDRERFENHIAKDNYTDSYASVYSIGEKGTYPKLVYDFDGPMRSSHRAMQKANNAILGLGATPRVYFSGRGYHIYVDLKKGVNDLKGLSLGLAEKCQFLPMVDPVLVGNPRTVARLPGTKNSKSGLWAIEIDPKWDLDNIVKRSKRRDGVEMDVELLDPDVIPIPRETEPITQGREHVPVSMVVKGIGGGKVAGIPPCIEAMMQELKDTGELDHKQRVAMTSTLLMAGWTEADLQSFYRDHAGDYNEGLTRYQIHWIASREYRPARCESIQTLGYCSREADCPFFPSIARRIAGKGHLGRQQGAGVYLTHD